jgi:quercetin dioxygenase-like cupin family protein
MLSILSLFMLASAGYAQDSDAMTFASAAKSKFVNMPVLPQCLTVAVQRGDPGKGPSVLLLKFKAGCVVPWHWHTAAEGLMLVSGTGRAEMKGGGAPITMRAGDYAFLPGKSVHQFAAMTNVVMFDSPEAAFDIHYVDGSGNEIPPDKALRSVIKVKPAAAPTTPAQ